MLALTAIIAVWTASLLAFRENANLTQQRTHLIALSSRLDVADPDRLQSAAYPRVANDMDTWEVYVPDGKSFEIRFGVAAVSQAGMPESYEKIPIAPGKHRITLRAADSADEKYRFTVFVDGQSVVDKTMGREWMPDGWRQASGLSPPAEMSRQAASMLHLTGQSYTPRTNYGSGSYFNGQSDDWVSLPGYRLWMDQADQTYPPALPFIGFSTDPGHIGIGLRDGLRYRATRSKQYEWTINRPASQTNKPVLTIVHEFFIGDQLVLSDQTKEFARWQARDEARGQNALAWQSDPMKSAYSAFLHADVESADAIEPVVELRWDASRPDDIGIRLPATPANENLTKWRLRIIGGASHLWRLLDVDERQLDVRTSFSDTAAQSFSYPLPIELDPQSDDPYFIAWRTDVTKPLQMLERSKNNPNAYRGMSLFQGMPLAFEAEIAASLQPLVTIVRAQKHVDKPSILMPGGPVIEEVQIELDATSEDTIWLRVVPR
nr:hypothetical protein [uncultured bacterium]